jgi:alginate O-acetyltransferase complex protein AlgI
MLFPTINFAVFFALVFPLTWLCNRKNTAKKWFLVGASYFFYGFSSIEYIPLLFFSSLGNFCIGLWLGRLKNPKSKLFLLWLGIAGNLAVLGYFKYYNFFVASSLNLLSDLGFRVQLQFVEVALPIAISFLTFHALSYIIDVYRNRLKPSRSLVDILLYISFFPHLIAGPIVRAKMFLAQTKKISDPDKIALGFSVFLIIGGLFKKVIVANYIATDFVDGVFRYPQDYSSADLLLGTYGYAIQIYCDFSAYTDIAIGVANLLGYQFPQNFNQPYRALTIQDFWRRWHITLSSWLRDYLYIPLGGSRFGRAATYRNILITMILGGLWHGASFNFIIWGLLHGVGLVVERVLGFGETIKTYRRSTFSKLAWWVITFHFVCLAWIFFRAPTLEASMNYISSLFHNQNGWIVTMTPLVMVMMIFGAMTQIIPSKLVREMERRYDCAPVLIKILIPSLAILAIAMAAPSGVPPFIYFRF